MNTRCIRLRGLRAAKFDIEYYPTGDEIDGEACSNFQDITSHSGFWLLASCL